VRQSDYVGADGRYADIVEREMYNGALAGVSLSGDRFFYENPLASQGGHHRVAWYETSCCPTNLVRFLAAIGQYVYVTTENGISVNQYVSSEAELKPGLGGRRRGWNRSANANDSLSVGWQHRSRYTAVVG